MVPTTVITELFNILCSQQPYEIGKYLSLQVGHWDTKGLTTFVYCSPNSPGEAWCCPPTLIQHASKLEMRQWSYSGGTSTVALETSVSIAPGWLHFLHLQVCVCRADVAWHSQTSQLCTQKAGQMYPNRMSTLLLRPHPSNLFSSLIFTSYAKPPHPHSQKRTSSTPKAHLRIR